MNRPVAVAALAALASFAPAARAQPADRAPRYALDAPAAPGRPATAVLASRLAAALEAEGWRAASPPEVTVKVRWTFREPEGVEVAGKPTRARWCAAVTPVWWDGAGETVTPCASGPVYYGFDPVGPSADALAQAIVPAAREALLAGAAARWVFRATGASARGSAAFRVGALDATPLVAWSGDGATLSVARGGVVAVTVGSCRAEAGDGTAQVDVARLGAERAVLPRWTVDGRDLPAAPLPKGKAFQVLLALADAARADAGAVVLPCAGAAGSEPTARLVAEGFDVRELSTAHAPYSWMVQPKGDAGSLRVSLGGRDGQELWSAAATLEPSLWFRALRAVKDALGEVNATITAIVGALLGVVGLIAAVRKLWPGRGAPRAAEGDRTEPDHPDPGPDAG
jgi:hypothetical protein